MARAYRPLVLAGICSAVLAAAGCADQPIDGLASSEALLLTTTGTAAFFLERDGGTLWSVSDGGAESVLSTSGLENGKFLTLGSDLHFDERENSIVISRDTGKIKKIPRERQEQLLEIAALGQEDNVIRLFNEGFGETGGAYETAVSVMEDRTLKESVYGYFPFSATVCDEKLVVLGADWRDDVETLRSPLELTSFDALGGQTVIASWDDSLGREGVGMMGCLDERPVWVEYVNDVEGEASEESGTNILVTIDNAGRESRVPIVDAQSNVVTELCDNTFESWVVGDSIFAPCTDGKVVSIDLSSGLMTTPIDVAKERPGAFTLSYVSGEEVVALLLDWESGEAEIARYDLSGKKILGQVVPGLADSISDSDQAPVDFVLLAHPPS